MMPPQPQQPVHPVPPAGMSLGVDRSNVCMNQLSMHMFMEVEVF